VCRTRGQKASTVNDIYHVTTLHECQGKPVGKREPFYNKLSPTSFLRSASESRPTVLQCHSGTWIYVSTEANSNFRSRQDIQIALRYLVTIADIHSFCSLPYDRPKTYSKAGSPQCAIWYFRFQFPVSRRSFLKSWSLCLHICYTKPKFSCNLYQKSDKESQKHV
jgi:hypothetical protein